MNQAKVWAVCSLLFLVAIPADATNYYVSTSGNDANSGLSDVAAWRTLQHAANVVQAGDHVTVRAGTYAGFGYSGAGGTQVNSITFAADSGVVINAAATGGLNAGLNAINIEPSGGSVAGVTVSGFKINGGFDKAGIRLVNCDSCQVLNNDVANTGGEWGIFTNNASNTLIQGNDSHDNGGQHGLYLSHSKTCTVRNNKFHNNNWDGIHVNAGVDFPSSGHVIENNLIYENNLSGLDLEGLQNAFVINNAIYGNGKHGLTLHNLDDTTWAPSIVFPNTGNVIANNTVVNNDMFGIQMQSGGNTANTLLNNIFIPSSGSGYGSIGINGAATGLVSDYNAVIDRFSTNAGGSFITLAQWRSTTAQDTHSYLASTSGSFVNPGANDFHLKSGAPTIDAGITYTSLPSTDLDGNARVFGASPDAGAYEYGAAGGNQPPTVSSPAAATPNPVTGATTNLSVLGADDGGEANLIYTWSTTGTPPASVSFSPNASNASKNSVATFSKAGTYTLRAAIKDAGGLTVISDVVVAVNQTLTSISVAPNSATFVVNTQHQFAATANDQFGNALTSQPSFTWNVDPGAGTINSSGLLIAASAAGGPYTVSAKSGSVTGTANVTIKAANASPTLTFVSPADGSTFTEGQPITLKLHAVDSDGFITQTRFSDGGRMLGTSTDPDFTMTWNGASVGTHVVHADATDDAGGFAIKTIYVTVVPAPSGSGSVGGDDQLIIRSGVPAQFVCNGTGDVSIWTNHGGKVANFDISGGRTWNADGLSDGMLIAHKTCNGAKTRERVMVVR